MTVRRPFEEQLLEGPGPVPAAAAPELLARLDAETHFDLVVLRGRVVTAAAAKSGAFTGRLWPYLTDVPQSVPGLTSAAAEELGMIAAASRYVLCQTEELRCFLEGSIPAACGKCVLLPPILTQIPVSRAASPASSPLRLVYSGKFAPRWNTLEMTELPGLLAARGVAAELHMIGDKIHNSPGDYQQRMRAALEATGVIWEGGHSREDALRIAASCDIGLGWRHPELDASLELSTKVLEYGAIGLPVILNRTPMHEGAARRRLPAVRGEPGRRGRGGGRGVGRPAAVPAGGRRDRPGGRGVHAGPGGRTAAGIPQPGAAQGRPGRPRGGRPRPGCGSWWPGTT